MGVSGFAIFFNNLLLCHSTDGKWITFNHLPHRWNHTSRFILWGIRGFNFKITLIPKAGDPQGEPGAPSAEGTFHMNLKLFQCWPDTADKNQPPSTDISVFYALQGICEFPKKPLTSRAAACQQLTVPAQFPLGGNLSGRHSSEGSCQTSEHVRDAGDIRRILSGQAALGTSHSRTWAVC